MEEPSAEHVRAPLSDYMDPHISSTVGQCVSVLGADAYGRSVYEIKPGALLPEEGSTEAALSTPMLTRLVHTGFEALKSEAARTAGAEAAGLTLVLDMSNVRLGFWLLIVLPALRDLMRTFDNDYSDSVSRVLVDCTAPTGQEKHALLQVVRPWTLFRPLLSDALQAKCIAIDEGRALLPALEEHVHALDPAAQSCARAIRLRLEWLMGSRRPPRSQLVAKGIIRPSDEDGAAFGGVGDGEVQSVAALRALVEESPRPPSTRSPRSPTGAA